MKFGIYLYVLLASGFLYFGITTKSTKLVFAFFVTLTLFLSDVFLEAEKGHGLNREIGCFINSEGAYCARTFSYDLGNTPVVELDRDKPTAEVAGPPLSRVPGLEAKVIVEKQASVGGDLESNQSASSDESEPVSFGYFFLILFGGFIGWLASLLMNRDASMGIFWNIVVGVCGTLIGNLTLATLFGGAGMMIALIYAFVGTVVLLGIVNLVQRGRVR